MAERWIVARLRHETFFTLIALNERIADLLAARNAKPMRHYGGASRADLFARLDQPVLRPLPPVPFEYAEWKHARVNLDYHIAVEHHAYSVPHALVHEAVEVRLTATALEVFHAGHRVAAHRRSERRGGFTTDPAHMPKAHQAHHEWRPSHFIAWAGTIGPQTAALVAAILADRPHPECRPIRRTRRRWRSWWRISCGTRCRAGSCPSVSRSSPSSRRPRAARCRSAFCGRSVRIARQVERRS